MHLAAGGPLLLQDEPEEGRLARAGLPDEEDELALADLDADVVEGRPGLARVDLGDVLQSDHGCITTGRSEGSGHRRLRDDPAGYPVDIGAVGRTPERSGRATWRPTCGVYAWQRRARVPPGPLTCQIGLVLIAAGHPRRLGPTGEEDQRRSDHEEQRHEPERPRHTISDRSARSAHPRDVSPIPRPPSPRPPTAPK